MDEGERIGDDKKVTPHDAVDFNSPISATEELWLQAGED
jgi:hypothetical protein